MRPEAKSKSRSKLWNAIGGAKEIVGDAGYSANWTVAFPNLAAPGDTVVVGPYHFAFVAHGSQDTPGDNPGTAAAPHQITVGTSTADADKAAASLAAALIAETETTGAWGFLHPVNATGASATTDTVTINFWPGTQANADAHITVTATGTDPTVARVNIGVVCPTISREHNITIIDTTGESNTKGYYYLADGNLGESVIVLVKTAAGSDTPTIIGHLSDAAVAQVEALYAAGVDGTSSQFIWTGAWEQVNENGTALTFDAAT